MQAATPAHAANHSARLGNTSQQYQRAARIITETHWSIKEDDLMTRIRRMNLSVGERKEWISLISGDQPGTHRVIPSEGEEFEFADNNEESLEAQISRLLQGRCSVDTE